MNAFGSNPHLGFAASLDKDAHTTPEGSEAPKGPSVFDQMRSGSHQAGPSNMWDTNVCDEYGLPLRNSAYPPSTFASENNFPCPISGQEGIVPDVAFGNATYSMFDTAHFAQAHKWQNEQDDAIRSTHLSSDSFKLAEEAERMQLNYETELAYLSQNSELYPFLNYPSSIATSDTIDVLSTTETFVSPSSISTLPTSKGSSLSPIVQTPIGLHSSPSTSTEDSNASEKPTLDHPSPEKPPRVIKRRYRKKKVLTEEQAAEKRNAFLNRNREAASKCRTKKNIWMTELAESAKCAKMENEVLKAQHLELMEEVKLLRCAVEIIVKEDTQEPAQKIAGGEARPVTSGER